MGWAVGTDHNRSRHIGYDVPATCDQPDCGTPIDRGLGCACGGGRSGTVDNCGLFFCTRHLTSFVATGPGGEWVCERCAAGLESFDPTPDTAEWAQHVLTDESWAQWRAEYPEWAAQMQAIVDADDGMVTS
jgi:hypothetical protein